jgi:glycosyltransferase involved in cell wall biosynthesis
MHILIVNQAPIPVFAYGGTERVIWDLGKALTDAGHRVTYLVPEGSTCPFAQVITFRPGQQWRELIPSRIDLIHFQFNPGEQTEFSAPWLMTQHGNSEVSEPLPLNTVFVSADHAKRHRAETFVHNGLDWSGYGPIDLSKPKTHFHFLGKAAWRVKNVQGAIDVARTAHQRLVVMGGHRLNISRGFRFTWSPRIEFTGMIGGEQKFHVMRHSKGLIFPVRWHEPFGLAIIESLYFGCPIFATPYGAIPEIVTPEYGLLSAQKNELANGLNSLSFEPAACHAYAKTRFNANRMAQDYLHIYNRVLDGEKLNAAPPCMGEPAKNLPWS